MESNNMQQRLPEKILGREWETIAFTDNGKTEMTK